MCVCVCVGAWISLCVCVRVCLHNPSPSPKEPRRNHILKPLGCSRHVDHLGEAILGSVIRVACLSGRLLQKAVAALIFSIGGCSVCSELRAVRPHHESSTEGQCTQLVSTLA